MRKREEEAPERYREALSRALPDVKVDVSYTDDRRTLQVVCTGARRRRLTWVFDAAELASARNPENYFVSTMRICWES